LQDFPELATLPNPRVVRLLPLLALILVLVQVQIENGPRILTPWGYLAWQIGGNDAYVMVETEDQQRIAQQRCSQERRSLYSAARRVLSTLKMRWGWL